MAEAAWEIKSCMSRVREQNRVASSQYTEVEGGAWRVRVRHLIW